LSLVNWLAQFRLRLVFRGAFLVLALATVALAVSLLQQEKQLGYNNYQTNFKKTQQQISATLRHPTGQMALLNPPASGASATLHPVLLPFSALDFDDQNKVQQAIAMSGCLLQYADNASLCVGIGNNPWAGGYIYIAGSFASSGLVSHVRGEKNILLAHRMAVTVSLRGQHYQWIALYEQEPPLVNQPAIYGRLTGFTSETINKPKAKPERDFRGWIWQKPECASGTEENCLKDAFYSLRLPIPVLQEALFEKRRPVWPPEDLDQIQVELKILPPNSDAPVFDSRHPPVSAPFSLRDLQPMLLPGETLTIKKLSDKRELVQLTGNLEDADESSSLLTRLIRKLPVETDGPALSSHEIISTPLDKYQVDLQGDLRSASKSLSVVATRASWFVGAMLFAIFLVWLIIEIRIIRRITLLTKRADALSNTVVGAKGWERFDVQDLRNNDELGVLASCLHNLLQRVREDVEREAIRAEQEKDMWHAVGHEIMSPLQSLKALHSDSDEQSHRYIERMQQAIRVLYGSASPSEAFQSTNLQLSEIDLVAFMQHIAENAPCVGIPLVEFKGPEQAVIVRADEYSLEDVVTHILHNAQRYRTPGSTIQLVLTTTDNLAQVSIFNQGPQIPDDLINNIFEYGVSDQLDSGAKGNRGQGLFVAKTYMAKMGGTISVENVRDGVTFTLSLQRGARGLAGRHH
jgi:signal transduction histidine kinase